MHRDTQIDRLVWTLSLLAVENASAMGDTLKRPFEKPSRQGQFNAVDKWVQLALSQKHIQPAHLCSDAVFLRRVYLDVAGTLPTTTESRNFLKDRSTHKRTDLIDSLLTRSEYVDYSTMRWCDTLRVKAEFPINLWPNAVQAYHKWIHDAIASEMPYDRFVRELLTSSGSNFRVPQVNFYRGVQQKNPASLASAVALTFMGMRTGHGKQSRYEMNRREAIKFGLMGAAGVSMSGSVKAWGNTALPPLNPKAKSVIQIWMWGGPSHLDTFDPKPRAGYDYCGPLDRPIRTNVDGIQIGQLLPKLAKHADKYSLVRSLSHGVNAHETASYMVQTGHQVGRLVYPCLGAVISKFKGYGNGYTGIVPPYIVLTQPQGRFSEAGFLGPKCKPFSTGGDPAKNPFVVEGIVAQGISDERQKKRRELLHQLDSLGHALPESPQFARLDTCEKNAYGMMFGDSRKVFDLSLGKEEVRDRYGTTTFGQSCLMARRLVEHDVPYVTINYKGWDTHKQHFSIMNHKLPELDRGLAALLAPRNKKQINRQIEESLIVEITADGDTRCGNRELRIETSNGLTNPMVFQVGKLSEIGELEPNDKKAFQTSSKFPKLPKPDPIFNPWDQ